MPLFSKPITCALSPNTEPDDVRLAWNVLWKPSLWQEGNAVTQAQDWFKKYFNVDTAVSFNSGRSALLALLDAFGIGNGDEVLLQSFTCVAVPNSVRWAGATPIYVDIDDSLNIDPKEIEKKITKKTKAIIVQHTFGISADMDAIRALSKKHHFILIEDCAHTLGATYKGTKIGTMGDGAFFSFGRDKVVSSVWGGMAVISGKWKVQSVKLKTFQEKLPIPVKFWIFQQLLHPIAFSLILASYNIFIGKIMLWKLQKLHLLSYPVYSEEKRGERPLNFPAKFPNALAILLNQQLIKLDQYNKNRREISSIYIEKLHSTSFWQSRAKPRVRPESILDKTRMTLHDDAIFIRYPLFVENPDEVRRKAKKLGMLLGNWYHNVIDPTGVDFKTIGYTPGSCPKSEYAAKHIVNLPTRISKSDAERVINALE